MDVQWQIIASGWARLNASFECWCCGGRGFSLGRISFPCDLWVCVLCVGFFLLPDSNNTSHVALLSHLQLHQKKSGKRVLPVFYSDNYLSLVPSESTTVTIEFATKDLQGDEPLVEVDGYNVDVKPVDGAVSIVLNLNAQPSHWPESNIVPDSKALENVSK